MMLAAIFEAMISPEGLIVGCAWIAVWAVILIGALLAGNFFERRRRAWFWGLNMDHTPRGEGSP